MQISITVPELRGYLTEAMRDVADKQGLAPEQNPGAVALSLASLFQAHEEDQRRALEERFLDVVAELDTYFDRRQAPSHFVAAVLAGDLRGIVDRGDDLSLSIVPRIVRHLAQKRLNSAWGTPARFEAWIASTHPQEQSEEAGQAEQAHDRR